MTYGLQKQRGRLIRRPRKEISELIETKHITNKKWISYQSEHRDLTKHTRNSYMRRQTEWNHRYQKLKSKKSPGHNGIPNERFR